MFYRRKCECWKYAFVYLLTLFSRPAFKVFVGLWCWEPWRENLGRAHKKRPARTGLSLNLDLLHHHPSGWQLLAFLSIFVMMTVLSKRYVAPLIKALKPRVSHLKFLSIYHNFLQFQKSEIFSKFGITWMCLTLFFLLQRHTRTNTRALSLTSEKRGKEVPSEADVVVIGKNHPS